jgi:hypothetical protein
VLEVGFGLGGGQGVISASSVMATVTACMGAACSTSSVARRSMTS